jgi:hypothetical protein
MRQQRGFWTFGAVVGRASLVVGLILFAAAAASAQTVDFEPVFGDSFESGDFSTWDVVNNPGGDLAVSASAAMTGNSGLEATVIENGGPPPDGIFLGHAPTCQLIDAVAYEGVMGALVPFGPCGGVDLVEGTPLSGTKQDSDAAIRSLIRSPNGRDTDNTDADWTFSDNPTPGAPNVP